jgi:hypothetical protein
MALSGTGSLEKRVLYPGSDVADVGTGHADVSGTLLRNMRVTRRCIRQRVTSTIIRVTADRMVLPGKERARLGTG